MKAHSALYVLPLIGLMLGASLCSRRAGDKTVGKGLPYTIPWQDERVSLDLKELTAAAHPMGSLRQQELASYLQTQAKQIGLEVFRDDFKATVPDPAATEAARSVMATSTLELPLSNIYAKLVVPGSSCVVMLGSHYDAKRLDEGVSLGANDSGSSSAALLEIMRALSEMKSQLRCSVLAVWFDGEEAYLREWQDGEFRHPARITDHLYGSRHMAAQLQSCGSSQCLAAAWGGETIRAMILLDMIGMPGARLTRDLNSDPQLLEAAMRLDRDAYGSRYYGKSRASAVDDDHLPFAARKIPVLDLIDFENLSTWHTPEDRVETLSLTSIREISQLAASLVIELGPL